LFTKKQLAYIFLIVASTGFAAIPVLAKIAYTYGASPTDVVTIREIITVVIMWTLIAVGFRDTLRFTRRQLGTVLGMTLSAVVVGELAMFYSIRYIDVPLALTIAFTSPVLVSLCAVPLFGERFSLMKVVSLVVALIGIALTLQLYRVESFSLNLFGVGLAALTALMWTVYMLFARRAAEENSPVAVSAWMATMGAAAFLAIQGAAGLFDFASPLAMTISEDTPWQVYAICVVMAFTSTGLPSIGFIAAVKVLGASRGAIVNMIELPMTVILSSVFLSESIDAIQMVGVMAVLGGVGLTYFHNDAARPVVPPGQ
jgi:drug/metabolite transporter (DMT)-like permease